MNGFEKHDIKHSSASQINMYAKSPCAWVARYLYDHKFHFGAPARAGVLVEEAVVRVLAEGWSQEGAIKEAVAGYETSFLTGTDAHIKRGEGIPGMIENALDVLRPYGTPEMGTDLVYGKKQKKVELNCKGDGWELPIAGYLDFYFPERNLVVDLKTTMRLPSYMSPEHQRQGSIYRRAMGNATVEFLYVTPKKYKVLEIDNPAPVLGEIKAILTRQERMLRFDREEIKDLVPVVDSYYWSDDAKMRKELFGI